jgi:hypothetical protein
MNRRIRAYTMKGRVYTCPYTHTHLPIHSWATLLHLLLQHPQNIPPQRILRSGQDRLEAAHHTCRGKRGERVSIVHTTPVEAKGGSE